MPKEKKPSDTPGSKKKSTAKNSSTKKAAPKKTSVAEVIASTPPVSSSPLASRSVRTAQPSPADLYDEIRRRAYEFYRERGGEHGSHEADWHRAESEVRSKYQQ
jgi:hypothetical protein